MEFFKGILYLLSVIACFACMLLLFRGYINTRLRILLWTALCFVCLTANNVLIFVDLVLLPTDIDLRLPRHLASLTGLMFMIYGFIFDAD